jgi:hypothetical protein
MASLPALHAAPVLLGVKPATQFAAPEFNVALAVLPTAYRCSAASVAVALETSSCLGISLALTLGSGEITVVFAIAFLPPVVSLTNTFRC